MESPFYYAQITFKENNNMKINLSNLKAGQVFKNYKQMCQELEMEVKNSTNSKNAQFKELECYCDFVKDGHKIFINEIFENKKDKESNYKGGKNIYSDLVQLLIVDKLMQDKEQHISISKSQLKQSIGMQNSNYATSKAHINKLSNYLKMDISFIYDFYNINDGSFNGIIETALKNLSQKRIIIYNTVYKCKPCDSDIIRDMNKFEMSKVSEIELDIAYELGYKSLEEVRKSRKYLVHQTKCKKKYKDDLGIEYYYNAYDIAINTKYIEKEKIELINSIKDYNDRDNKKTELNELIMSKIVENAEKRHEGSSKKLSNKKRLTRSDDNYVENTKILSNTLIKRSTPNLTGFILAENNDAYVADISEMLPF